MYYASFPLASFIGQGKTTSEHYSPLAHISKNLLLSLARHSLAPLSVEPLHLVEPRIVIALLMKFYFLVEFLFQKSYFPWRKVITREVSFSAKCCFWEAETICLFKLVKQRYIIK